MNQHLHRTRCRAVLLLVFCVALTVIHTWPMALAPHRHSRVDNGDYLLNAWAIAWVSHQITAHPSRLFDGNIFWPERRTLAYSEAMIVQGLMAAPVLKLGGSPVLAFNLVMMAGFTLTALAFGLLAYRWTGSWSAALVSASAAGFNSHLFMRLGQLQAMHVEFIALTLLGLDLVFTSQRVRDAVVLALGFALQGLTSVYLMVFTTWALIYGAAMRMVDAERGTRLRAVKLLTLAGAISVLLMGFYLNAYYQLHRDQGFSRPASANESYAGSYADYLSTGSRLHYGWSRTFVERCSSANFPGFTVLALVVAGLAAPAVRRAPRVRMCTAIAAGCVLTSVAPTVPGYAAVHPWVPLFWAVRVQAHIGQVVLLALALLAGYGAVRLREVWGPRRHWWAVVAGIVILINAEVLRAPIGWREFQGIPPIYDVLAAERQAVVAELPLFETRGWFGNAIYMLNSTRHWHPILNGYSGFVPASYERTWMDIGGFPNYTALEALRSRGVTHVVLHRESFLRRNGQAAFDEIPGIASLREIAHDGDIYIYRFR